MRSCTQNPDPPTGVLDDRQHIKACTGQGDGLEEVTGKQGPRLGAEETGPGSRDTFRRRVDPGLPEDLPDGEGSDRDTQDEQLTVDAPVTPRRVLPDQAGRLPASSRSMTRFVTAWATQDATG